MFDGSGTPKTRARVSLAGKSAQRSDDRESLLQKARAERALRSQRREQASAALTIQRIWRGHHTLCKLRSSQTVPSGISIRDAHLLSVLGNSRDYRWSVSCMLSLARSVQQLSCGVDSLGSHIMSDVDTGRQSVRLQRLALLALRIVAAQPHHKSLVPVAQLFSLLVHARCSSGTGHVGAWLMHNGILPSARQLLDASELTERDFSPGRLALRTICDDVISKCEAKNVTDSLTVDLLSHHRAWRSFGHELSLLDVHLLFSSLGSLLNHCNRDAHAVQSYLARVHGQWASAHLLCNILQLASVHGWSVSTERSDPGIVDGVALVCHLGCQLLWHLPHGSFGVDGELDEADELEDGELGGTTAPRAGDRPEDGMLKEHLQVLVSYDTLRALLHIGANTCWCNKRAFVASCELVLAAFLRAGKEERGKLIFNLSFSADLSQALWNATKQLHQVNFRVEQQHAHEEAWIPVMAIVTPVLSVVMLSADDVDFFEHKHPIPPEECTTLVDMLRTCLWRLAWVDPSNGIKLSSSPSRLAAVGGIQNLLAHLNTRNSRRPFITEAHFTASELTPYVTSSPRAAHFISDAREEGKRAHELLKRGPALVPFPLRVRAVQDLIRQDKQRVGRSAGLEAMGFGERVRVRRNNLFTDGMRALHNRSRDALKGSIKVEFVDAFGVEEAGIDGGGLLKDFIESLCKEAFSPELGLFRETADHKLYPNPHSGYATEEYLTCFEFLGIALGKAMYEGILVELPLAHFFLSKLKGKANGFNDLHSLDDELWRQLAYLKRYDGNVEELGLTFTVSSGEDTAADEVNLIPHGKQTSVTQANVARYVELVARYKLNTQIASQASAFLRGFQRLIHREWLSMFNENELQTLISGRQEEGIDVDDLFANCVYSGGFSAGDQPIRNLFASLRAMSGEQQRMFLRFVTACPNPPLLGFKELQPPFTVHRAASGQGEEEDNKRLPSATTCSNVLKLPPYRDSKILHEKMLLAIHDARGFHLS